MQSQTSQKREWRHPEPGFSRVKDLARIIPTPGDVEKPIPAAESLTSMCTPLRDAASCIMPTGVHEETPELTMNVPLTPIRCLYRAVDLYGKKRAVVSGPSSFTYAQFGERCERLAAGLLSEGVRPGDRVAYLSFNNHQLLEGYYGPPLIRAIAMPLNVRLQPAELTAILNHASAGTLVFESDFAPLVQELRKSCPSIRRYIAIDQPVPQADLLLEDLLARDRIPRPDIFSFDENEIAELFYTSGSTGMPKGVMLSHRTLYVHALGSARVISLQGH